MSIGIKSSVWAAALVSAALVGSARGDFVLFGEQDPQVAAMSGPEKFVKPISQPFFNEDSFITTDVRLWALYHDFGDSFGQDFFVRQGTGSRVNRQPQGLGGNAMVFALQGRLALTDRLQFVAYKDGFTTIDTDIKDVAVDGTFDSGIFAPVGLGSGYNDIAVGLKYQFYRDVPNKLFAAAGVGYEFPVGDKDVLQNNDEWRAWVSVSKGYGPMHFNAVLNYFYQDGSDAFTLVPGTDSSHSISWHLHADWYAGPYFSPVAELHGYHYIDRGSEFSINGVDLTNLGGGGDIIIFTVGGEVRPMPQTQPDFGVRLAVDVPASFDEDPDSLYGWRASLSIVYDF